MISVKPLRYLLLGALAACGRPQAPPAPVFEAIIARPGQHVTVQGTVTVPSGVIDAGFAISDGESGIHVDADSSVRMRVGEGVRVHGTRTDVHGMLSIRPDSIERVRPMALPPPRSVATSAVTGVMEGWMVRVRGRALAPAESDLPYGWKLQVDDGSGPVQVFFPAGGGDFGLGRIHAGSAVSVTGFGGRYDDTYEVIPASPADLVVSGAP